MSGFDSKMAAEGLRQCLLLWSVDYWNLEGKQASSQPMKQPTSQPITIYRY